MINYSKVGGGTLNSNVNVDCWAVTDIYLYNGWYDAVYKSLGRRKYTDVGHKKNGVNFIFINSNSCWFIITQLKYNVQQYNYFSKKTKRTIISKKNKRTKNYCYISQSTVSINNYCNWICMNSRTVPFWSADLRYRNARGLFIKMVERQFEVAKRQLEVPEWCSGSLRLNLTTGPLWRGILCGSGTIRGISYTPYTTCWCHMMCAHFALSFRNRRRSGSMI